MRTIVLILLALAGISLTSTDADAGGIPPARRGVTGVAIRYVRARQRPAHPPVASATCT